MTDALAWMFYTLTDIEKLSGYGFPELIVVTSVNDSTHSKNSKHYTNQAIDIRSHNFPNSKAKEMFRSLLEQHLNNHPRLPKRFRVLIEDEGKDNEHFHCQVAKGKQFP